MPMVTYPLNNIEYTAEDAELFHSTRKSGVYAANSFDYSVTGADNTVVIGTGIAWIKNSAFSGKVVAQKEPVSLDLDLPDPNYPRIDAIVIQFDANKNASEIIIKKGAASSNPVSPSIVRTESAYELHLYHIRRNAGALTISAGNITDLRLNANYCGLMADSVTEIDTDAIERQIAELIANLNEEIEKVKDESAFWLKEDVIPVNNGGTGATNSEKARENLSAAPSGYGLGEENGKNCTNPDDALNNGWYALSGETSTTPPGIPGEIGYGHLFVERRENSIFHTMKHLDWVITRRSDDGGETWSEPEWDNPPMYLDTEYRTVERYLGKPVYTRIKSFGALPANGTKRIAICEVDKLVDFTAIAYNPSTAVIIKLPDNGNNPLNVTMWFKEASLYINTNNDLSDYTEVYVTFKYTKP